MNAQQEQDRAHKLELLAIVAVQYLANVYNLKLSLASKGETAPSLAAEDQKELSIMLSLLSASHQNYLIFLHRLYLRVWKPQVDNVSRRLGCRGGCRRSASF